MTELRLLKCRLDGRYDILDCLGRGSYAEIYVARDLAATAPAFSKVVIKALNLLLQGYQDAELERTLIQNFENEATALDRVRHPNIINHLGSGTATDLAGEKFHYMVLEYLGGGDLAALCRRRPLRLDRALFYLQHVCSGLAHAHARGVIHRDIKPQNLLLTADQETVKIADFGVAKLEASDGAITRVGTNIYAAPEHNPLVRTGQLDSASLQIVQTHLTPAADIYSLAKTTYTFLTGEPPRRFAQHAIRELPANVAAEFWAPSALRVLERATQTQTSERYQTVEEFWDELTRAVGLLPLVLPSTDETQVRRPRSDDARLNAIGAPAAPPRPRFEVRREPEQVRVADNGARRPRIVVPIVSGSAALTRRQVAKTSKVIVAVLLVLAFAGMILATHTYVRSRWNQVTNPPASVTTIIGREAVTTTDLFLWPDPSTANDPVGLAELGSRVRVLHVSGNWCEVQVLLHGRAKDYPESADRGWVRRKYLKFE